MRKELEAFIEESFAGLPPSPETEQAKAQAPSEDKAEVELREKKRNLTGAVVVTLLLLYVSMGQMLPFGLPPLPVPEHLHPV